MTTTTTPTNKEENVDSTKESIQIPDKLFFRIGDVADLVGVKPYVLRFWESEFPFIAPHKSVSGQRVYRKSEVENILLIKHLLYEQRYSIEGAKKRLRELRSEGELKTFKNEHVVAKPASAPLNPVNEDKLAQVTALARELQGLARAPVQQLFRY